MSESARKWSGELRGIRPVPFYRLAYRDLREIKFLNIILEEKELPEEIILLWPYSC